MTASVRQIRTDSGTATSRAALARPAVRRAVKARLAIIAPSGAGKTWTALSVASALAPGGRVVVIDTEANEPDGTAAELYADTFDFGVIPWAPPYDPRDLAATIVDLGASGVDVIIVDSASHFWRGPGGTLSIADSRFGGWKTATPAQDDLVTAILTAPCHVIVCARAKEQYLVDESSGKQSVTKLGLGAVQRDDLEYEFQVVTMMNMAHQLDIGKTRASPLAGRSFLPNHEHEFAAVYAQWLAKGLDLIRQVDVDAIRLSLSVAALGSEQARAEAVAAFREQFGPSEGLERGQLADVWAWIAGRRNLDAHPFDAIDPPEQGSDEPDDAYVRRASRAAATCRHCQTLIVAGWHHMPSATASPPEPPSGPQGDEPVPDGIDVPDVPPDPAATPTAPPAAPDETGGMTAYDREDAEAAAAEAATPARPGRKAR